MTVRIGVACEDRGHLESLAALIDTVLVESTWVDEAQLSFARTYGGVGGRSYVNLKTKEDPKVFAALLRQSGDPILARVKLHGFIKGVPAKREAPMFRRAMLRFWVSDPRPQLVVCVRDEDGVSEKSEGFEQVRMAYPWPFEMLLAFPKPEIEGWKVCAFEARDATERARLVELTEELSFNPVKRPERLTSKREHMPADAKRVLRILSDHDEARAMEGLRRPSGDLERVGPTNGLSTFIQALRVTLPKIFGA